MGLKRIKKIKDKCEICHGNEGGVPGNENIHYVSVDNKHKTYSVIVCDYCSSKWFS